MRISIITPTIDDAPFIDEAITSLRTAKEADVEHIIVHDGAPSYAAALAVRYPHLRILAGPGTGPTSAIAQGIAAATGDFIGYVSSDDRLLGSALDTLAKAAATKPGIRLWTGGTRVFRHDTQDAEVTVRLLTSPALTAATLENVVDDLPLVNARFFHRTIFTEFGGLDPRFPELSDRELMIRVAMARIPESSLGLIASEQRQHKGSRTQHRQRDLVPLYLREHLLIADMWLSRSDTPPAAKRLFRRWRTREVLRLTFAEGRTGQWARALRTFAHEAVRDPLLPLWAPSSLAAWRRRRRNDNASAAS